MDLGGFCICYSVKHFTYFDTNIVTIPIFSTLDPFFAFNSQTKTLKNVWQTASRRGLIYYGFTEVALRVIYNNCIPCSVKRKGLFDTIINLLEIITYIKIPYMCSLRVLCEQRFEQMHYHSITLTAALQQRLFS